MDKNDLIRQYVTTGRSLPEKQLAQLKDNFLKSYIRQRLMAHNGNANQANPMQRNHLLSPFEIDIAIKLGVGVDFNGYDGKNPRHVSVILSHIPEKINTIDEVKLNSIAGYELWQIFQKNEKVIDLITDEKIKSLSASIVVDFMIAAPKRVVPLVTKEQYKNIIGYNLKTLLIALPQLLPKFKKQISTLDKHDKDILTSQQPKIIDPLIKMGVIKIDDIRGHYLLLWVDKTPERLHDIPKSVRHKISSWEIMELLADYPEMFSKVPKWMLDALGEYDVKNLITKQPKLHKYFDNLISKMDYYQLGLMIETNPELIKPLFKYWGKLEGIELKMFIDSVPEGFELVQDILSDYEIVSILKKHPKLIKKLTKERSGNIGSHYADDINAIIQKQG